MLKPFNHLLLMNLFKVMREYQAYWTSMNLYSCVFNVVLKELTNVENLKISFVKVGPNIERFFVKKQSLVDKLCIVAIFKEMDTLSCEIAILT